MRDKKTNVITCDGRPMLGSFMQSCQLELKKPHTVIIKLPENTIYRDYCGNCFVTFCNTNGVKDVGEK